MVEGLGRTGALPERLEAGQSGDLPRGAEGWETVGLRQGAGVGCTGLQEMPTEAVSSDTSALPVARRTCEEQGQYGSRPECGLPEIPLCIG